MISKYRLFILIFIPAALVLAVGMALIQQKNSELSSEQFEAQLKSQWQLASLLAEEPAYQDELSKLHDEYGLRITLIDSDGEVLSDSAVSGRLESHKNREEFKKALSNAPAMVVRYSRTIDAHTIYYAERLPDGRVLRVAYPAAYYDARNNSLIDQAMTGLAVLVAAVALFAFFISRKMSVILISLSRAVREAQAGGQELPGFDNEDIDQALFALSAANRDLKLYSEENFNLRQRLEYILANIDEGVLFLIDDRIVYHNPRVEEILDFQVPERLSDIGNQEMIDIFGSFVDGQNGNLQLGDKTIVVSQASSEHSRLILLRDISDQERYSGYKSDLVGNISHELKTPMTLIMGAAEVIVKDPEMPRAYLDKFLHTIYKNTQRINLLLDDLIFLHQLEGANESEPVETNLKEMVEDLKHLLGQTGKEVSYQFDQGSVRIHATHLISILTNLIGNADKYSQGRSIEVEVKKAAGALELKVSDHGPRIPASEAKRIFERFYTVSKSRNREESGSGLGLSIVKHIARIYKGQVLLAANSRGGNDFIVRLLEK